MFKYSKGASKLREHIRQHSAVASATEKLNNKIRQLESDICKLEAEKLVLEQRIARYEKETSKAKTRTRN
jgi:phage shock protein A